MRGFEPGRGSGLIWQRLCLSFLVGMLLSGCLAEAPLTFDDDGGATEEDAAASSPSFSGQGQENNGYESPESGWENQASDAIAAGDGASPAAEECTPELRLAQRGATLQILETYCAGCHQPGASGAGAIENILNFDALVTSGKVKPGHPSESPLVLRMLSETAPMPPASVELQPSQDEIQAVEDWISCLESGVSGSPDEDAGSTGGEDAGSPGEEQDAGSGGEWGWPEAESFAGCEPENAASLKSTTAEILSHYCSSCHKPVGGVPSKISDITDFSELLEDNLVWPGDPESSPLYKRMHNGTMPPAQSVGPQPTDNAIAVVGQWISCMDQVAPDSAISQKQVYQWIQADTAKFQEFQLFNMRYVSLAHLYNSGATEDELEQYRQGVSKVMNSLSWNAEVSAVPVVEGTLGLVMRLDLEKFGWDSFPLAIGNFQGQGLWQLVEQEFPYAATYSSFCEELM